MPDADPLAAELDAIEARNDQCAAPSADIRRLLALASVLLDGHVPVPLYLPARHGDGRDGASACTHDPDHASHFEGEDGEWLCGDSPDGFDCGKCREELIDGGDGWPCGVYTGAYEALTGEKVTGDGS